MVLISGDLDLVLGGESSVADFSDALLVQGAVFPIFDFFVFTPFKVLEYFSGDCHS